MLPALYTATTDTQIILKMRNSIYWRVRLISEFFLTNNSIEKSSQQDHITPTHSSYSSPFMERKVTSKATIVTKACHRSLSSATLIQSPRSHIIYLRSVSILSSHIRLVLSSRFCQDFQGKLCPYFSHLRCALRAPPISPSLI